MVQRRPATVTKVCTETGIGVQVRKKASSPSLRLRRISRAWCPPCSSWSGSTAAMPIRVQSYQR